MELHNAGNGTTHFTVTNHNLSFTARADPEFYERGVVIWPA